MSNYVEKTNIISALQRFHANDLALFGKASDVSALSARVSNLEQTTGQQEITVSYPNDGNYSSLMPNKVPASVADYAEIPTIRGKSRAWNQLFNKSNYDSSHTENNVTFTNNADGSISIQTTSSGASSNTSFSLGISSIIDGHKYMLVLGKAVSGLLLVNNYTSALAINNTFADIKTCDISVNVALFSIRVNSGTVISTAIRVVPQLFDLTLIFGSGNEPSTVAEALAQLPALGQYNAYGYSLPSTIVSGMKSVGVNIFDEEVEVGTIDGTTGANVAYANEIRSKNYCPITPLTTYYFIKGSGTLATQFYFYDKNKNFISHVISQSSFTTPINAFYLRFRFGDSYGLTYLNNVQICLNSLPDAVKQTYHPYMTDTLSLSTPVTLRSAGSVSDELDVESGVVTRRIASEDLGSLNWSRAALASDANKYRFYASIDDYKRPSNWQAVANISCPTILATSYYNVYSGNEGIAMHQNGEGVEIYLTQYNTLTKEQFKAAMNGVYLNYELATPTTESIDPVPYNFLEVEGGGTVETIQTQTPVIDNCLDVTYDTIPA